jgi:hypothetical protein
MIGNLLGKTIRVVSLPLDAVNAGFDILTGGDGTKRSRTDLPFPTALLEELRDRVAEAAKEIDKKNP